MHTRFRIEWLLTPGILSTSVLSCRVSNYLLSARCYTRQRNGEARERSAGTTGAIAATNRENRS